VSYALPESGDNYSGRGLGFSRTVTYWRTRLCPALTHRWPVEGQQQYCLDGRHHDGQDDAVAQDEESLYYKAPDYSTYHPGKDSYDYAPGSRRDIISSGLWSYSIDSSRYIRHTIGVAMTHCV
jgi:hypothetical protein